ncbi:MAG TPA: Bax inhibitor-1/YccA family protein [Chitinophagaceae bacterium]|nr:Bax inhibitor-1/YccA family protein [Chitinophagales bacterium]HRX95013.1 Bax inhibitor-1/YccA family protein [Chitinophagaceae bacterium]
MALFRSSNPVLQEKRFEGTVLEGISTGEEMTIKGTMNKFGVLMALMIASTMFAWNQFYKGSDPMPFMMVGVFGGLGLAILMAFKMKWAAYLAPAYAILEGLFVGSVSAMYNNAYQPGLIIQAVALTLLVTLIMFLIYRYRIIKVTKKLRTVVVTATAAIAIFYLIQWLTFSFGGSAIASGFTNSATPLSIGFSVLVTGLAAFNLLLNFDMIEKGAEMKAPKYMEWFGAFGLLVTIVWLYLEILRLLSKLQRN